ncbi:hypothetical protein [Planktotalea sp.]|uniref:hypothetical protein n=1 Tax=Planktotalea sp. TaxID=2029877 RepID=UPI0025CC23AB|nr:hypothetical protein [Planktotalea sp.]
MYATRVNPKTMYDSLAFGFSHGALSEGTRLLYLAGQVAWDRKAALVGTGGLAAHSGDRRPDTTTEAVSKPRCIV